jgi:phospholipase/carboxylesterase
MDARTPIDYLPPGGPPDLLFLLFHGVGGQPYDMSPVMDRLTAEYPRAALVALPAPHPFDGVPGGGAGGQWFPIRDIHEHNRPLRVAAALPGFVQAVREQQRRFGIDWPHTALVGFSQGAIMALEAVQHEPQLAGRVLGFSGRFARLPEHAPVDTTVHLLHGMQDTVVPPGPAVEAARRLVALGGDVTADVLPDIGHELHPLLVARAIEQLRSFLPKRAWREALSEAPLQNRVASSRELDRRGTVQ